MYKEFIATKTEMKISEILLESGFYESIPKALEAIKQGKILLEETKEIHSNIKKSYHPLALASRHIKTRCFEGIRTPIKEDEIKKTEKLILWCNKRILKINN